MPLNEKHLSPDMAGNIRIIIWA
jgi:hypothetical protein